MVKDFLSALHEISQIAQVGNWTSVVHEGALKDIFTTYCIENPELFKLYASKANSKLMPSKEDIEFCSFGYILSIDDAVNVYNRKEFLGFKQNGLFPFVSDLVGDYLLLDIGAPEKAVYLYSPSLFIVVPVAIFDNLAAFIFSILECYLTKAYRIQNNKLHVDMDAGNRIFQKNSSVYRAWSENC